MDPQQPRIKMLPSIAPCQRELRLNAAGIPVKCGKTGFELLVGSDGNGPVLCKHHMEETMDVVENLIRK